MTPRLAVVGTGPVAAAIATGYADAGGAVVAVVSRDPSRARSLARVVGPGCAAPELLDASTFDLLVVAVPDAAVATVGSTLLPGLASAVRCDDGPPLVVLHTSGALEGVELIRLCGAQPGVATGSLHPLQSFPRGDGAASSDVATRRRAYGVHWFHEGAGGDAAAAVVAALEGRVHALAPGGKSLYHAGAAVLSNHLVALFDMAVDLFGAAGVERDDATASLLKLLDGTVRNLHTAGLPRALTGPVARGDSSTVEAHLRALKAARPELLPAYRSLALRALAIAIGRGSVTADQAERLTQLLRADP